MFSRSFVAAVLLLSVAGLCASSRTFAVGNGLDFSVEEQTVLEALPHDLKANSMDLTYHACVDIGGADNKRLREEGYFWISSYQDADSVVDSQINYYQNNGYHIYGIYTFAAGRIGNPQQTPSGIRLNYLVNPNNAGLKLFLDPEADTLLLRDPNCHIAIDNQDDDLLIGTANNIAQGEKSETSGLANGDFELVFSGWQWGPAGVLFDAPANFHFLDFNANVTQLDVPINAPHRAEGSGNLFWLEHFAPMD